MSVGVAMVALVAQECLVLITMSEMTSNVRPQRWLIVHNSLSQSVLGLRKIQ
jgi:hypothetical protein